VHVTFESDIDRILGEARDLLLRKHKNYGPKNISQSPGGPLNGLRVRLHDKFARVNHMIDHDAEDAVGEPLEETFLDALNYCTIAVMVQRGLWPEADEVATATTAAPYMPPVNSYVPGRYSDAVGVEWYEDDYGSWWRVSDVEMSPRDGFVNLGALRRARG
jgi:hypothetical protein